ncbi:hypothetical protein AGMMS50229_01570 [Campylobacterota bacterium]|nr:hypothetical protein AGMMS50229_01570 [Campylobacterota bacterium]
MEKIVKLCLLALAFAVALSGAALPKIVDHQIVKDRITINFDRAVDEKSINIFFLTDKKTGVFRRVVDIKAIYPQKPFTDSKTAVPTIKIAQFSGNTTRVVLAFSTVFNISVRTLEKQLIIEIDAKEVKPAEATAAPKTQPKTATKPIVMIDAGHGGQDTGAPSKKIYEKEIALSIAKYAAAALKTRGFEVKMTRENDSFVALPDRTNKANRSKADIFISVHANANPFSPKLEGLETYFLSPARSKRAKEVAAQENSVVVENMGRYSQETFLNFLNREMVVSSNKLAIDIQRGMLSGARSIYDKAQDNGVREAPFWVLVGAQMPAVLVEVGYITQENELKRLSDAKYQKAIAEGIARGVESYFVNMQNK